MARPQAKSPITAILYSDGHEADKMMARLARTLQDRGLRLAGFVQQNLPRAGRRRCDMALLELSSGDIIGISQDRGPEARGCHLDTGELLRGMQLARRALDGKPDLLLINKFGKTEGEGSGFRPLIAEAVERGVPVLIAVPWRNIDSWRVFSGDLSTEYLIEDLTDGPSGIDPAYGLPQDVTKPATGPFGATEADSAAIMAVTGEDQTLKAENFDLFGLLTAHSRDGEAALACLRSGNAAARH